MSSALGTHLHTSLVAQSENILEKSSFAPVDAERILEQWVKVLPTLKEDTLKQALDQMEALYTRIQKDGSVESNKSFLCMLKTYSVYSPSGKDALRIIEKWNAVLMGDLEGAPSLCDYNAVLEAYALSEDEEDLENAAYVAIETINLLQLWGFAMAPSLRTFSLATCCIYKQIAHGGTTEELNQSLEFVVLSGLLDKLSDRSARVEWTNSYWVSVALGCLVRACVQEAMTGQTLQVATTTSISFSRDIVSWMKQWVEVTSKLYEMPDVIPSGVEETKDAHVADTIGAFLSVLEGVNMPILKAWNGSSAVSVFDDALRLLSKTRNEAPVVNELIFRAMRALPVDLADSVSTQWAATWLTRIEHNHSTQMGEGYLSSSAEQRSLLLLMMAYLEAEMHRGVWDTWKVLIRSPHLKPDAKAFRVVLRSLAMQGTFRAAERAFSIWSKTVSTPPERRLCEMDLDHHQLVMTACANSKDLRAREPCLEVMEYLVKQSKLDSKLEPGLVHHLALIKCLGRTTKSTRDDQILRAVHRLRQSGLLLDVPSYTACIAGLVRSKSEEGLEKAQSMLDEMLAQGLAADVSCFQNVLRGWADSGRSDALSHCESLLSKLESLCRKRKEEDSSLRLNAHCYISYSMVCEKNPEVAPDPDQILHRMKEAAAEGISDPPDRAIYTAIMRAYYRAGSPHDVIRVFDLMEEDFKNGNVLASPDARTYALILNVWAKSREVDKARKTRDLLTYLCNEYELSGNLALKPNAQCFGAVLNACAFSESQTVEEYDLVDIAVTTGSDMERVLGVLSEYSIVQIFNIIGRHATNKNFRNEVGSRYFAKACQNGLVSKRVMGTLRTCLPELYHQLPDQIQRNWENLPKQWTHSVIARPP